MENKIKYNYNILEDIDNLYSFFEKNKNIFKKHHNGETNFNRHLDNIRILKNNFNIQFPYGYCFPISQFIFYYLGCYENININLMCIKKIPIKINEYSFYTSHWFVYDKINNQIIDLTKKQFDKILDIENHYHLARRSNYGFPYFKKNTKRFDNTVPSLQVIKLYEKFRDKNKNIFLETYYQSFKQIIYELNK
jgi:hypothetical protein